MPSPATLDIKALLAPISQENPCGIDLHARLDSTSALGRVREARNSAASGERTLLDNAFSGETTADQERARLQVEAQTARNWQIVFDLGQMALAEQTKDLDIATYLVEAAVRLEGFAGLRDGFRVLGGLVETFWGQLHPRQQDSETRTDIAILTGLTARDGAVLKTPVRRVPVTDTPDGRIFTFGDFLSPLRGEDGRIPTQDDIRQTIGKSSQPFLDTLKDDLRDSIAALSTLERRLTDRLKWDAVAEAQEIAVAIAAMLDEDLPPEVTEGILGKLKVQTAAIGAIAVDQPVDAALKALRGHHYALAQSLRGEIGEVLEDIRDRADSIGECLKVAVPAFAPVVAELTAIRDLVVSVAGETITEPEMEEPIEQPDDSRGDIAEPMAPVKPAAQVGIAVAPERIQSRDDAFQQLSKIAEYFRRTEPQSPIATAIEEVVRRGKLSFAELAAELIPDESARRNFMITAGIKPK